MNNLMIFENKEVEVFKFKGQILFNPYDVAKCLGIKNFYSSIKGYDHRHMVKLENSDMLNVKFRKLHYKGENFLTLGGVYLLIFNTRKEGKERFREWIAIKVLYQVKPLEEKKAGEEFIKVNERIFEGDEQMNNLKIFENNNFGAVRGIEIDGNIYFVGKDIARCLGYIDTDQAIRRHCKQTITSPVKMTVGTRTVKLIPESDVYRLIIKSKLPAAEKFESWVMDEVLPQIRETGGYIPHDEDDSEEDIIAKALLIAKKKIDKLNKKIDEDSHKVLFANAVTHSEDSILIRQLAKLISQNGINIGEKRLFAWLRDNGYLIKSGKDKNEPTQKSMNMKLFDVSEAVIIRNGKEILSRTSYVTGKGQAYFINKFLKLYSEAV